eukprot:CAMPEP_0174818522 /NCGR_PEP_ID=MMETSP1107-20130205/1209_1 /TAXON_ID=36770 /ORGANISM="Paraphysomonas vestita, Strain GFlagA" /LENGTH=486 /DNA_ID=CAMNT_0016030461 /DNA_START=205 /DNA_END=1665 /DNA_ORIENTATION=-
MTSQRWLTDADFSESSDAGSIWWHWMVVIVPDEIKFTRNASMWITGGGMSSNPPTADSEDILVSAALACSVGTVTTVLFQIPNEHITFASDPIQKSRTEDAIIAYTWDHFLNDPSQPEWLFCFSMVKASIRAMDATKEFMDKELPQLGTSLDYFAVSGASKRGWTTWLVGAVDPTRVMAIAPVVLDAINFVAVEHHEYRSYGGWSYALQDYIDMHLTVRFDDPNMIHLQEMEDPYFYFDRLTMPKMVVNAVADEFQQPDDTHYWWSDLPEPKHFMMIPNAEHSLITGIFQAVPAIGSWIQNLLYKEEIPTFTWTINEQTGELVATLDNNNKVHSAYVWWAYSCGINSWDGVYRRDFRIAHLDNPCSCGAYVDGYCGALRSVFWSKQELNYTLVKGKRTYSAKFDAPGDGRYVAFLMDFKFNNKHAFEISPAELYKAAGLKENPEQAFGGFPHDFGRFFEFTTEVSVWPNTFPYADCVGADCGETIL